MGVARDDRSYVAEGEHLLGDVIVDVSDRVPQQVALGSAYELGFLADAGSGVDVMP